VRGRSYGIVLAGVLLSALPWLVTSQVIQRHQSLEQARRGERVRSHLCLALSAAAHALAGPRSADGASGMASLVPLLSALQLSPPALQLGQQSAGTIAGNPSPVSGVSASVAMASDRVPGSSCPNLPGERKLHLALDPDQPHGLVITRHDGAAGQAAAALRLNTAELLRGEGSVGLLEPSSPRAAGDPRVLQPFRVAGANLLIALPAQADQADVGQIRRLAASLAALGLLITLSLALRSESEGRRQRGRQESLRVDRQSGLLSRLALEQDLEVGGLLLMVHLRLLQRQGPFRRDEEIRAVFESVRQALGEAAAGVGPSARFYRASEHRLAMLLQAPPEDDGALLQLLEGAPRATLQEQSGTSLRADDLLVTGQRLGEGITATAAIDLHGYGETLALASGGSVRLIEAEDRQRVQEEAAVREQLQNLGPGDIRLEFQPILLLASPGRFGLEALLRFQRPLLREQSTSRLMQTAHELGIAHRIDGLVLRRLPDLLRALKEQPTLDARITYIALNISGDSFATPQRLEQLISSLQELAIDPERFCLEFTETPSSDASTDSMAVTIASERLTRELKLRIAIDDFGSGLSNYKRICDAWYDSIKLDIALVAGIGNSFRMQRYVGSLIETVHSLGKTVVCEGVDDHADFTAAVRLGADAIQGYLIAKPMAWEAIEGFLDQAEWASAERITTMVRKIHESDRLVLPELHQSSQTAVPLERQILDKWFELRSFEEFLLLFVNELKRWGLDILRLSLAFLPDQDDIDCSQYIWLPAQPSEVRSLRMDRAFLQQEEHLSSALHHIANHARFYRQRLASRRDVEFSFLEQLKDQGCNDYLGLRLDSRGISIPVLTIALRGESSFSDEQIQRIVSMSSLLSLLFYTFESERAKRLALLDPLTNLPNRRSFDSFLNANISASHINNTSLALALIDIDRFKHVNDSLGHAYGDACLREVAAILRADLRPNRDFVARLGGEEFALILPDTNAEQARQLCELLREAVTRARVPSSDNRAAMPISVSLGIAIWEPVNGLESDADRLLQVADDCLYEAKRLGRNRVISRLVGS
jgi:diguanylate cyclase (GGDEF)-like protein